MGAPRRSAAGRSGSAESARQPRLASGCRASGSTLLLAAAAPSRLLFRRTSGPSPTPKQETTEPSKFRVGDFPFVTPAPPEIAAILGA